MSVYECIPFKQAVESTLYKRIFPAHCSHPNGAPDFLLSPFRIILRGEVLILAPRYWMNLHSPMGGMNNSITKNHITMLLNYRYPPPRAEGKQ